MATGFGGSVKLTGESAYRKALKQITQNLKEVDSELKLVASQYDKNDKSEEALSAQTEAYNKKLALQEQQIDALEGKQKEQTRVLEDLRKNHDELQKTLQEESDKLLEIEKTNGKASQEYKDQADTVNVLAKEYQKFEDSIDRQEQALSKTNTELNNTKTNLNQTKNTLKELSGEMDDTEKETKELGEDMENAGNDSRESSEGFTVFKAVVADLAASAIKEAINGLKELAQAVIDAGKALADTSFDAGKLADEVNTLSMQTGLSTDTIQELNYASELLDVSTDTITGSMTRLTRSMNSANEGSAETASAFEQMGIAITDSNGELRDNEEVFWDVIDYLGTMENTTERDATAMTLLGRSAQELNPLIIQGSDAFRSLADEAHETGYVMDSDTLDSFQGLDDGMQRLQNGVTGARNALGRILLPMLSNLSSQGTSLLNNFTNALNGTNGDLSQIGSVVSALLPQVTEVLTSLGEQVGGLLGELIPQLIEQIPPIVESALPMLISGFNTVLDAILSILPTVIPTIATLIPEVASTLLSQLPRLIQVGVQIILQLVQGISQALPSLLRQLPSIISEVSQTLIRLLPEIIQTGILLLMSLIEGITDALPLLIQEIPVVIGTLVETLTQPDMLRMIIEGGMQLILALIEGLADAVPALIEYAPTLVQTIINVVTENLPGILQLGKDLLNKFIEGCQIVFGALRAKASEIYEIVRSKIAELPGKMIEIGQNLVQGLWNGISNMTDWVISKIQGFGDSVLQGLRDFFGIASPSKVFAEMGGYMAQGLGLGFEDEMAAVTEQMRDAVPTSFDVTAGDVSSVGTIGGGFDYYTLVDAFREALMGVDVTMDDIRMGKFVRKTVSDAIYT